MNSVEENSYAKANHLQKSLNYKEDSNFFKDFQNDFLNEKKSLSLSVDKLEEESQNQKILPNPACRAENTQNQNELIEEKPPKLNSKKTTKSLVYNLKKLKHPLKKPKIPPCLMNDLAYDKENDCKQSSYWMKMFFFMKRQFLFKSLISKNIINHKIHPFKTFLIFWDVFMFFNTLALFFYIPILIDFDVFNKISANTIKAFEIFFFLIDGFIRMNTSQIRNGVLIESRIQILWFYMKKHFILDLIAFIALIFLTSEPSQDLSLISRLTPLLFFSKLKSFKMNLEKLKEFISFKNQKKNIFEIAVLVTSSFLLAHVFACFFYFIGQNSNSETNWLHYYYIDNKTVPEQYLYSLYWAIITIFTLGSGAIIPQNSTEVSFTMLTLIFGFIVFSYNLNKVGSIFLAKTKLEKKIQNKINKITSFMQSENMNYDLQMRVREYLNYVLQKRCERMNRKLLKTIEILSPSLKDEFYHQGYKSIIKSNNLIFGQFSEEAIIELAKCVQEETLLKDKIVFLSKEKENQCFYFVKSGEIQVFHQNNRNHAPTVLKTIREKGSFGEFSFLTGFNHIYSTKATVYTKLYKISRINLIEILKKFPQDFEKFCELKDRAIFSNGLINLDIKCSLCKDKDHFINMCNPTHFVSNRHKIIKNHLISIEQQRKPFERKKRKINALINKRKITKSLKKNDFPKIIVSENFTNEESSENIEFKNEENNLIKKITIDEEFSEESHENLRTMKRKKDKDKINLNFDSIKSYKSFYPEKNIVNFIQKHNELRKKIVRIFEKPSKYPKKKKIEEISDLEKKNIEHLKSTVVNDNKKENHKILNNMFNSTISLRSPHLKEIKNPDYFFEDCDNYSNI